MTNCKIQKTERLQTVLARAGVASRRYAAELIKIGKVKVDGSVVKEKGLRVNPKEHEILIDGHPLPERDKIFHFLFNKPKDVISTAKDTHGRKKVLDFFNKIDARLYPVGRLDKDTTGLLIVTNDGELARRLMHPSFEIEKEYMAVVKPCISREDIHKLQTGIMLDGKKTSPCSIKLANKENEATVYMIKLHEGRKRQIKRMFEAQGARIMRLERTKYAGLTLKRLKQGEFRELDKKEIKHLKKIVGLL